MSYAPRHREGGKAHAERMSISTVGTPTKNGVNPEGCTPPQHNNRYAAKWKVWKAENASGAIFLAISAMAN